MESELLVIVCASYHACMHACMCVLCTMCEEGARAWPR